MARRPSFRLEPYRLLPGVDWLLIVTVVLLAAYGVVALWGVTLGGPYVLCARRQAVFALLGLGVMIGLVFFDYRKLGGKAGWVFYGILVMALGLLLLKGEAIKGARSWIDLGPVRLQPSEPGKIVVTLVLAYYLSRHILTFGRLTSTILPGLIAALPIGMILIQPDLGSAVVYLPIVGSMFWVAGLRKRVVVVMLLLGVVAAAAGYPHLKDYQKARIHTFLNPEADPRGKGYNIIQAQAALGSGQLAGKGWGQGTQVRLGFLPENHTDFIFPAVGEQFGLIGCSLLLALLGVLIWRLVRIAQTCQDLFGVLIVTGVTAALATHVVMNVGMCVGLLPVTGLPLPFFSYGGSFLVTTMASIGLALSVGVRRGL